MKNKQTADANRTSNLVYDDSHYSVVGNDIIMGYNVNFDINFLYDFLLRKHDRKSPALGWLVYGFVMLAATAFAVYRALRLWKAGV